MSVAAVMLILSKTLEENMRSATKKKQRLSYSVMFKLAAVCYAEIYGNRATARYIGVNEKQIRDWRSKKHHLIHCDSKAKRLKGAARQGDENKIIVNDQKDFQINTEKNCLSGYSAWNIEGSEEEKTHFMSYFFDISTKNRQLYGGAYQYRRTNLTGATSNEQIKETEKEVDFHERFSCALALLDLKKGI